MDLAAGRGRDLRLFIFVVVVALLSVVATPTAARAYVFGEPSVSATGPEKVEFDHSSASCDENDIPDISARAFRDSLGRVQLIASHANTRRMLGPDLDHLTHDCKVVMGSSVNSDPSAYNDREWLASPYTLDGRTIYGLVHMEFQGWNYSPCPYSWDDPVLKNTCWMNAITSATSTDSGESYHQIAPPGHLVASEPDRYDATGGPFGLFTPTNIVKRNDGYYYTLAWAISKGSNEGGVCVMRTLTLDSPSSWRAWNGTDFSVRFINPYLESADPRSAHECKQIPQPEIGIQPESLTYSTYLEKYVLVGHGVVDSTAPGFYYATSDDLVHWSSRKLLMEGEMPWTFRCGDASPVRDPSLLDPASPSRNFETIGQTAYLYFTRFNPTYDNYTCWLTLDRDLVRIPIKFTKPAPPRISISDVSKAEGNSSTSLFTLTLTLSSPSTQDVSVDFITADGSGRVSDNDYYTRARTKTFLPGQTTKTVNVIVAGDKKFEPDEDFFVNLSDPVNATIADDQGKATIQSDDSQPQISISDVSKPEGNSGTSLFTLSLSLSNPSYQPVSVDFRTADGSATVAGSDYLARAGTKTFLPGEVLKTINPKVIGDTVLEPDEDFFVNLSNPVSASIADFQGKATIQDDLP
jgi:hypothetical protein